MWLEDEVARAYREASLRRAREYRLAATARRARRARKPAVGAESDGTARSSRDRQPLALRPMWKRSRTFEARKA